MQMPLAKTLRRAHAALFEDLRKLEQAARPGAGGDLAQLMACLGATHKHVTEHFGFEEQDGYMDTVRKREPRFDRIIQQLGEEHRELMQSLDALIREVRKAACFEDAVREKIRMWVERLRRHEARENDLVQDAFSLDIGLED
jgi:hypothetical protein